MSDYHPGIVLSHFCIREVSTLLQWLVFASLLMVSFFREICCSRVTVRTSKAFFI
jgi:hypothetical protein